MKFRSVLIKHPSCSLLRNLEYNCTMLLNNWTIFAISSNGWIEKSFSKVKTTRFEFLQSDIVREYAKTFTKVSTTVTYYRQLLTHNFGNVPSGLYQNGPKYITENPIPSRSFQNVGSQFHFKLSSSTSNSSNSIFPKSSVSPIILIDLTTYLKHCRWIC